MKTKNYSLVVFIIVSVFIGLCIIWKETQSKKENDPGIISWDVSGYYYYLPSIFIYKDLKNLSFKDALFNKYHPTPSFDQAIKVKNGNYVFKYSCGQAIVYLPSFLVGHFIANILNYPIDGFCKPYQISLEIGCFLITLLGLWFIRKILLKYFNDKITAITLLTVVLLTNYLNYTGFYGAMTHNTIFTLYTFIIYFSILFYEGPSYKRSIIIGLLIGLAALIRPTEIISSLIPILWGVDIISKKSLLLRWNFIRQHFPKYTLSIVICIAIGSIQLIYWKYVSGHWLVYSYQEQGFEWLHPNIVNGLFSFTSGWLLYTPIMIFVLVGIYFMNKIQATKKLVSVVLIFIVLFIYVAFSWKIWWYGGSLGQRTMVQTYALLCIPLGTFYEYISKSNLLKALIGLTFILFLYLNLWWTYIANMTNFFYPELINRAFFLHVQGKLPIDENDLKVLDTNDRNVKNYKKAEILYINNFEKDSTSNTFGEKPINGTRSFCVDKNVQYTPEFCFNITGSTYQYIRTKAILRCSWRGWDFWKYAQLIIRYKYHSNSIKEKFIRLDWFFDNGETKPIYFDIKVPEKQFDEVCIILWNGDGQNRFLMDDLKVEGLVTQ